MKKLFTPLSSWTILLAVAVGVYGLFPSGARANEVCSNPPGPDQANIEAFVKAECYKNWGMENPPVRLTGAEVDGIFYTRHQYLQVYYSPEVAEWLENGRQGTIPDDAMIVALEYAQGEQPGELQRILTKVKDKKSSHDGWFWSLTSLAEPSQSKGQFGAPSCLGCHGSADNPELTFLNPDDPANAADWKPRKSLKWSSASPPPVTRQLPSPLPEADKGFLEFFNVPDIPASEVVPFPGKEHDHVVAGYYAGPDQNQQQTFITSDQCMACHNASQQLSNTAPHMWYPNPRDQKDPNAPHRNYSPYGEWSASMNGLSGRDPVWHAQVESERFLRPHLADFTDDTCFSCHGPMAGRQLRTDTGDPSKKFTIDMFYALPGDPNAKYGALARDGVSCVVCHSIDAEGLGVDPEVIEGFPTWHKYPSELETYTALFNVTEALAMWGPYKAKSINTKSMTQSIGMPAGYAEHMGESKLCGSCHTVIVPALPVGYEGTDPFNDEVIEIAYEQTTYWEWRNSIYQNEREPKGLLPAPCQVCHMLPHNKKQVANIENDQFPPVQARLEDADIKLKKQNPLWRHILMGINVPVFKMYQQFPDILGSQLHDPTVPEETLNPMLNVEDWMVDFAQRKAVHLEILSAEEVAGNLEAKLQITNLAGHKIPTGAGFRRAFIKFQVLDENDNVLWVSGETSPYGVILGGDGEPLESEFTLVPEKSQPHYQEITRQDEVQIYEVRALDSEGMLQTTVLGIFREYKDNRLLPLGWDPEGPNDYATEARIPAKYGRLNPINVIRDENGRIIGRKNDHCHDGYDPDYCEEELTKHGRDNYVYRIPLDQIPGWVRVEAKMYYQTIPPYFLADRFRDGKKNGEYGRDTKRLIHIASRLNLEGTAVEGWKLKLGPTTSMKKGEPARPGLAMEQAIEMVKAPNGY